MVVGTGVTVWATPLSLTVTQAGFCSTVVVGAILVVDVVAGDPHGHMAARRANVANGATFGMTRCVKYKSGAAGG